MNREDVGARLRQMRVDRGWSATYVAKNVGVTQQAYSLYEHGIRMPRDDVKVRIAMLFGCTVGEIFFP